MAALARPALTVDVSAAQQQKPPRGSSRGAALSSAATSSAAAANAVKGQVAASAGPSRGAASASAAQPASSYVNGADSRASLEQQWQDPQPQERTSLNGAIRPGDIISEDELAAQGGFSSEDDTHDMYGNSDVASRQQAGGRRAGDVAHVPQQDYDVDSQDFVDSDSSEGDGYVQEGEMGSEDDDDVYDEDEEELSSSPSIPDENIDFDLVYALHNFIATVEGQATVNKGNSLTLLDDSNSYWWLVRVLRSQEVGYIPAENIETPFERLARLNKHRNVDLTSATDDDHNQIPENIITSHLVKSRLRGSSAFSAHSGKLSALSQRSHGPTPTKGSGTAQEGKRGVVFGEPTYLEHSGTEYSDEDDEDMIDIDDEDDGEYDDEEEDEEDDVDHEDDGERSDHQTQSTLGNSRQASTKASQSDMRTSNAPAANSNHVDRMEPDDGMDWDDRKTENVQRTSEERMAAKQAAQQRMANANAGEARQTQSLAQATSAREASKQDVRQQDTAQAQQQLQQQNQQEKQYQAQLAQHHHQLQQQLQQQQQPVQQQGARRRPSQEQNRMAVAQQDGNRLSMNSASSAGSSFLPSQVQAGRERSGSDAFQYQSSVDNSTVSSKKDKRASHRKSRGEDDSVLSTTGADEKPGKKRSGVFSGLFSRSKDKKERKSGHFSNSSIDADGSRTSEDSSHRQSLTNHGARAVAERDRAQQEAYTRQFLSADGTPSGRTARPGSLIGPPGTAPMLNVLRIFAGTDIHSGATFKTVLLNETTTAEDLVRQALQRFRLGANMSLSDYCLTVKLVEGDERILEPSEMPLQVFDKLTAVLATYNRDTPSTIPSVKRSSVGSISSISSNLSLNPAIARLQGDFSDDHDVKFYLHRRNPTGDNSISTQGSAGKAADLSTPRSSMRDGNSSFASANDSQTLGSESLLSGDLSSEAQQMAQQRFPLRLLIFPSDLPEGMVFDPQTNALMPRKALAERGPGGAGPSDGVPQDYREKILALPRNSTVAEVIEQGLARFGILDGVVEGGDDVEDRGSRRRSKGRIRFGLCIKVGQNSERGLAPNGKVLEAFPTPPQFRNSVSNRRSKRLSTDSTMLLSQFDDFQESDPVFVLRQVQRHRHSARPLSPTENVLATKQDQRRQAELETVASQPSSGAIDEARSGTVPSTMAPQGMSRQEIIAAQRAAARERRAAVLGSRPNEENGLDVMLDDRSRLRSSRIGDSGKMRYSFIPVSGEEHDISAIIEEVTRDEKVSYSGPSFLSASNAQRPNMGSIRSGSATSIGEYVSAPNTPTASSPLPLEEVHMTGSYGDSTRQLRGGQVDALQSLVRGSAHDNGTAEERIELVLSRIERKAAGQNGSDQARGAPTAQPPGQGSASSSRETGTPTSGNTHASGTTTPTPLSMLTAGAAGGAALTAGSEAVSSTNNGGRNRSVPGAFGAASSGPSNIVPRSTGATKLKTPTPAAMDFGVAHLYALTEAAARKRPPRRRPASKAYPAGTESVFTTGMRSEADDMRPTVAGLFPPQAPFIDDRRVKDAYAPIGRSLNGLEETLDRLLSDVLRGF